MLKNVTTMRNRTLLLIICLYYAHLLATELKSPFAEGYWVKIAIEESGVYKLPFDTLRAWGFDDPECIAVYGNGASMPLELNNNSSQFYYDNIIKEVPLYQNNKKRYHLFYGEGPKNFKNGHFIHYQWDNSTYYFITNHKSNCNVKDSTINIDTTKSFIDQYPHYEDLLQRNSSPEIDMDRNYYGETLITNTIKSINLDSFKSSKYPVLFKLKAFSNHKNGKLKIIYAEGDTIIDFPNQAQQYEHTIRVSSNSSKIQLIFNSEDSSAQLFINEMFTYKKKNLELNTVPIMFSYNHLLAENIKDWTLTNEMYLKILTPYDSAKTWRIETPHHIYNINVSYTGNSYYVPLILTRHGKYLCFREQNCKVPSFVQEIKNKDIFNNQSVKYLIISHTDFIEQAQRLANLREGKNNFSTLVVDTKDIYNVFSSGMKSPDAIRFFSQYLYEKNDTKSDSLKFIVLFGHGVCNPLLEGQDIYDKIPTYNSGIQGDNIFGVMDPHISPYIASTKDIEVGRLPAITVEEAKILVDKIIHYEYDFGYWRNTFLFTAGKKEQNRNRDFFREVDCHAEHLHNVDSSLLIKKVYFDNFENYGKVNSILELDINKGVQLIAYSGHSNINFWEGKVMSIETIRRLENKHLPIIISNSCNYAEFDKKSRCAAEELLLNAHGGAIAVIGGTRSVYGNGLDEKTCNQESSLLYPLLKINDANYVSDLIQMTNKNGEVLLGDPALGFNVKNEFTFEDVEIENEDKNIKVTGKIAHINSSSNFSGFYDIKLLGKPDTIQTQNYLDISQSIIYRNTIINQQCFEGSNHFKYNIPANKDVHFLNLYAYNDLGETASCIIRLKRENNSNKLNSDETTKLRLAGKQLQGDFSAISCIKVFDVYGRIHFYSIPHHSTKSINLPLNSGIYILIYSYENGKLYSEKVLIK